MNGSPKMIIKLGQDPGFEGFVHKDKAVRAAKMNRDFLLETTIGFLEGKKGDWIVEIADDVRFPCAEKAFLGAYLPLQLPDCDRRCGAAERRRADPS